MSAKGGKKYYTIFYSLGNTEIHGVEKGQIGMWVAKFGGNDAQMEELLLEREVKIGREKITLKLEDRK